jgi:hypothetical protein
MSSNQPGSAIVTKQTSAIAPFVSRDEVREIARRVKIMSPGGKKLTEPEALALAQGALMHGLDPFIGEIWYIPGSGLMAGIKGLRKAAKGQVKNYWTEFNRITNREEMTALSIPEGALAFQCLLYDSSTIDAYADAWAKLRDKGVPVEMIPDLIGRRPYVEGVGYLKAGEKTKMDPVQCAMKRAESDALKRRFDLPFGVAVTPEEVVDVEWAVVDDEPATEIPEAVRSEDQETQARYAETETQARAQREEQDTMTPDEIHDKGIRASDTMFGAGTPRPIDQETSFSGGGAPAPPEPEPEARRYPTNEEQAEMALSEMDDRAQAGAETAGNAPGRPEPMPKASRLENQWEQSILKLAVDLGLASHEAHAVNILNKSCLVTVPFEKLSTTEGLAYLVGYARLKEESDASVTSAERAEYLNEMWKEHDPAIEEFRKKAAQMVAGAQ